MKKLFLAVWQWGQWKAARDFPGWRSVIQREEISAQCQNKHLSRLWRLMHFVAWKKSSMPFELQIRLRINDFADEARAVHLRGKDVGNLFRHMFSYIIEFTAIKSSGRSTCETREKICSPNNTHSLSMNASFLRNSNSAASRMENWNQVEVNYYLRDLQLMTEFVASLASIHNESWFTVDWKESVSADVRSRTSSRWNDFALGGSEFWEINGRWLS